VERKGCAGNMDELRQVIYSSVCVGYGIERIKNDWQGISAKIFAHCVYGVQKMSGINIFWKLPV
jgi:hypothetical protein